MSTLSHAGDIYKKIADDKNKGFIKDEYVDAANKWISENGARINFRGTGHPDRPVPKLFMEVMEELSKEKINYTPATGAAEERKQLARYTNMMNLPGEVWQELLEKFKHTTDFKAVKQALYDVLDGKGSVGVDVILKPENVNTVQSGTAAFAAIMKVCMQKGDKAMFIAPFYNAYDTAIKPTEAGVVLVDSKASDNFVPQKGAILKAYNDNPEVKLIFLPSSNPTGSSLSHANAESFVDELLEVHKLAKEKGQKVRFVSDVVYHELSEAGDTPIYRVLTERAAKGDEAAKELMKDFIHIESFSKIGQIASIAGAIITHDEEVRKAVEGTVIGDNLASNPLGSRMMQEYLKRVIDNKAALLMVGKNPQDEGMVNDAGKSYGKERDFLNKGWDALAHAYGAIDLDKGETLLPHNSEKALYSFPEIVRLFKDIELPKDKTVFGNIDLRDFVLDDPNKKGITNGNEASRLLYAMAGQADVKVGVQGRPGEWFGYDQAERFNVTGTRAELTETLQVVNALMKFIGAEQKRDFIPGYEAVGHDVKPKTAVQDLFSQLNQGGDKVHQV